MNRLIFSTVFIAMMVGCIPQPQTQYQPRPRPMIQMFRSDDFAKYMGEGSGSVTGQAFLKTRGGDVKYGAGCQVELCPVTPYIQERLNRQTFGREFLEEQDVRVNDFSRRTIADGNGNFEFKKVPPGKWVVYCVINWMVPGPYGGHQTGGTAVSVVEVRDNETTKAVVTR